jgi:hypothetical protein
MAEGFRSPLDGVDRVVIDGSNLLHALGAGGGPPAAAIGRVRSVIPGPIGIELVFDGPSQGATGRIASGMNVRYAGRLTGDQVIVGLIEAMVAGDAARSGRPVGDIPVLVVTDDRGLRGHVTRLGARTAGTAWLMGRLEHAGLVAPSTGNRKPPHVPAGSPGASADGDAAAERRPWRPGRGATTKHGNARKVPRHRRRP